MHLASFRQVPVASAVAAASVHSDADASTVGIRHWTAVVAAVRGATASQHQDHLWCQTGAAVHGARIIIIIAVIRRQHVRYRRVDALVVMGFTHHSIGIVAGCIGAAVSGRCRNRVVDRSGIVRDQSIGNPIQRNETTRGVDLQLRRCLQPGLWYAVFGWRKSHAKQGFCSHGAGAHLLCACSAVRIGVAAVSDTAADGCVVRHNLRKETGTEIDSDAHEIPGRQGGRAAGSIVDAV
mmetsp:Transcript_6378/g.17384  ORF Transcript_6378/g.17384 Transcript_6378/m.17384 type:complete len:237 (-) Transcript_6378:677-1387(-)